MNTIQEQSVWDIKLIWDNDEGAQNYVYEMARDNGRAALDMTEVEEHESTDERAVSEARDWAESKLSDALALWYEETIEDALDAVKHQELAKMMIRQQVYGHGTAVFDDLARSFLGDVWDDLVQEWRESQQED